MAKLNVYVAGAICVIYSLTLFHGSSRYESPSHRPVNGGIVSVSSLTHTPIKCSRRKYVPSAWETQWVTSADDLAAREVICPTMQASSDLVDQWLAGVAACKQNTAICWSALPGKLFSKFVQECKPAGAVGLRAGGAGRGVVVEEYIESLVGHMRHPHALSACVPPGGHEVDVQDPNYLMLLGDDHAAVRARPGAGHPCRRRHQ